MSWAAVQKQTDETMGYRVLVVEDEIFIAINIESVIETIGHACVGTAATSRKALELAPGADLAFVDLNLNDGPTGLELGRELAGRGITVTYMTANPEQLGTGVPGTIGVLSKPVDDNELRQAMEYAIATRRRQAGTHPPRRMKLFAPPDRELTAR